jgi:hypothetical protein
MATVKLTSDGQSIQVADDIANDFNKLRKVLGQYYPDLSNAELKREVVEGETVVSITKKAGTKGGSHAPLAPLQYLLAAPEELNPVLALSWQITLMKVQGTFNFEWLMHYGTQVDQAATIGRAEGNLNSVALGYLKKARPVAPSGVPPCF